MQKGNLVIVNTASKLKFLRIIFFVTFTTSILVLLYAIIFRIDFFGNHYPLQVQFSSIGTIKPGSPVRKLGVKIGSVKEININQNDLKTVLVTLSINNGYVVQKEDIIRVAITGILGDQYIDITPADQGGSPATSKDLLFGETTSGDISTMSANFSSFLQANQKTFEKILQNIETISNQVVFSLPEIQATVKNIYQISEGLKNISSHVDDKENLQNVNIILSNIASFSSDLKKISNALQKALP